MGKIKLLRLRKVISNFKKLTEAKIQLRVFSDSKMQQFILHLNQSEQIFNEGVDSKGDSLRTYTKFTEEINEGNTFTFNGQTKTKRWGDPYFLFDKGDFFATFDVKQDGQGVKITADSDFEGNFLLTDSYVTDILGLNEKSSNELAAAIVPFAIKFVREQILK